MQSLLGSRPTWVKLALALPVALPTIYLAYFSWQVSRHTSSTKGRRPASRTRDAPANALPWTPASLPEQVRADDAGWVLTYERVVSLPVPVSSLAIPATIVADEGETPSLLMRAYAVGAQVAFSSTPQAYLMRNAIGEPRLRRTFDKDWIRALAFHNGDIVNGVYRVAYHGKGSTSRSERVELVIEAPLSFKGSAPHGLILAEVQLDDDGDHVLFVNETWMWRRDDEKPTLIEGSVGGWFHSLLAGWLVMKGIRNVTG
ncbi:uncharacterized protein F5Z01DRAFT_675365 [Emericellopsis atlantica]|uniref:Uncharacterized protein n=1 Tax=Emericellopsis atlantica TaxID=2614577 RepID=A0A9P8CNE1_9HYPO|nr:uncharacterized protein F5Z01DRAFT_675365 [Emericellopsis atlantica]KAG9252960.1 hypothetical protein F5Z01DRAFT_675365 [Emericellopsis atlantica]